MILILRQPIPAEQKCAWGKIFGQWIEGAGIFVFHFSGKFQATEVLPLTFCCPPTIYRSHPSVREAAVVGSPDRIRGMIVKSFVVLNNGYESSEPLSRELKKYVKRKTAPYKYPWEIEFVQDLPKTISGKIRRSDLRASELKKYIERQ